jgi:hypothetical protein
MNANMDYIRISRTAPGERESTGFKSAPILRLPTCQSRFERLGLDAERAGTVCHGCQFNLEDGCPNTRAWSLDGGSIKPICEAETLVYCRHYDCGCDLCENFLSGMPIPPAGLR